MSFDLNDIPKLSDTDIEQVANDLLNDYENNSQWTLQCPIPVERIAEKHLGYHIEITDDDIYKDAEILGGIVFDDKVIQINGSIENHDGRYSFTIAHELGHHCLHKELFQKLGIEPDAHTNMCRETGEKLLAEQQADTFAAYLLMPTKFVKKAYIKAFGDTNEVFDIGYKKRHMLGSISSRVIESGNFDNVSLTAMTNRLIGMRLITGVSYQKSVMPDITPKTLKGLWKNRISALKKGVKRLKK
jgi:Zn-dependent peptidase ImmA (M78 family)